MFPGMTPQFPTPPLSCVCTDNRGINSDNNSGINITGLNIGPEIDDRFVILASSVRGRGSMEITTATFNGAATRRMASRVADVGPKFEDGAYHGAYVPAGTAMNVRLNWSGPCSNTGIAVYVVRGLYNTIERRQDGWDEATASFSVPITDDRLLFFQIDKIASYANATGTGLIFDAENQADVGLGEDDWHCRRFYHGFYTGPNNATWTVSNPFRTFGLSMTVR